MRNNWSIYAMTVWCVDRIRKAPTPRRGRNSVTPPGRCHCRLLAGRLRYARFDEAHVPSIGVASIDHDDATMLFAKIAIRARHSDGELGKAIPTIALDMRFDDFDRMAPGTGGEAVCIICREGLLATHDRTGRCDQHAVRGVERGH